MGGTIDAASRRNTMNIEKINGFWVPSNDIHIEDWRAGKPFTQNTCLLKFQDYCSKDNKKFKRALDIGAWVGTWSIAMKQYCDHVVAFEPERLHYSCLTKNVNGNIDTHELAIGAEQTKISLSEDNFTQSKRVIGEGSITMTTIDSLQLTDVDLIKIDVEGYEMEVLKGAEKTLENVQYIMIELNNNTKKYGSSNIEIETHIRTLGYKILMDHWPDKVFYRP